MILRQINGIGLPPKWSRLEGLDEANFLGLGMKYKQWLSFLSLVPVTSFIALSPIHAAGPAVIQAKVATVHLENGVPYIFFDQVIANPDGCTSNSRVVLANDLSNQQSYLSLAMTALASGKSVTVHVSGCVLSPWGITLPKVYAMQIIQ